jgi:4-amino-4-deoxy-L-arabinose transferase-like glycosyltransferase
MATLSLGLLGLRLAYWQWFSPYGLAPDEAQYWTWLQNLDLSYATKPPLTTWAMGLSTALLGHTLVGVKLFALLAQALVPLLGAALARALVPVPQQQRAGWLAFIMFSTVPLVAAGGLIMAPDALLLPLWLGALLALVRALAAPSSAGALCWPRWLLIGTLIGLAGLAKYTAALFFPLLVGLLLWQRPAWLQRPQIWAAALLALAFQAPVIYWNFHNDWAGLHHLLWQAAGDDRHGGLTSFLQFLGSQALVLGPVGLGLLLLGWGHVGARWRQAKPTVAAVWAFTLPIFLGFVAQAWFSKVQANWPLLATIPALALAAAWLATRWPLSRVARALLMAGLGLNLALSLALYNTQLLRPWLPHKADPTKDLLGWPQMGELLGSALQRLHNPIILGVRYQTLAPLAFHTTPAVDWIYWNAEGRRMVDYDDWNWPASLPNRPVVLVQESPNFSLHVAELFNNCRPWHNLGVEQHGEVVRRLYTWLCWGYRVQPK